MLSLSAWSQSADEKAIHDILAAQTIAWNKGDLENFMDGYWNNDSLLFIGKNGVNKGWQKTFENYQQGYPDTTAMGKLNFDILEVRPISPDYYFVVGKWHLQRSIGNLSGHFSLLFTKIKGQWKIVADHSS
jgi:ketosteroid isomerase-like protein